MARRVLALVLIALVAAGCGSQRGDGGPSEVRREDAKPSGDEAVVIATLGDSIVAGSPLWDPDPEVRGTLNGVDEDSQWQRWVASGDLELGNCGVWGERTDEIVERFADCTKGAEAVVIQGGINDIAQGRPVKDAARGLGCIAERARRGGLAVALVEVLPWNNGWPDAAPEVRDLNRRIHQIADRGGVPVLPFFTTLEDKKARDRMPERLTDDGNHPNVAGYRLLGERAWRAPVKPRAALADDC